MGDWPTRRPTIDVLKEFYDEQSKVSKTTPSGPTISVCRGPPRREARPPNCCCMDPFGFDHPEPRRDFEPRINATGRDHNDLEIQHTHRKISSNQPRLHSALGRPPLQPRLTASAAPLPVRRLGRHPRRPHFKPTAKRVIYLFSQAAPPTSTCTTTPEMRTSTGSSV